MATISIYAAVATSIQWFDIFFRLKAKMSSEKDIPKKSVKAGKNSIESNDSLLAYLYSPKFACNENAKNEESNKKTKENFSAFTSEEESWRTIKKSNKSCLFCC